MQKETEDRLLNEVRGIKMLLILQLLRDGTKQTEMAAALGVSPATMSRMIAKEVKSSIRSKVNGE